ncbi:MAG: pantoate--beta-alanine ligase [Alloprevotella sp.]|nr:pantoate--beta-alanine ligase [Alloprevotella sp.]
MQLVKTIAALEAALASARAEGRQVGLVPTMGALHEGHASLVRRSVEENDLTVVSVFVNPTQFNDPKDLDTYPRTPEADARLLESFGADIMFAPTPEEVYPEPDTRIFSYPPVTEVMEGPRRPGHFNGVCQVVSKLFMFVRPQRAYFGEKDFQQIAVIRAMEADLKQGVQIVSCPIVRENDGLALSSRNALLTADERELAVNISRILFYSVAYASSHTVGETHDMVVAALNALEGLEVEYFEIVDAHTLQAVKDWDDAEEVQGCITVYCGHRPVRLIDNVKYK